MPVQICCKSHKDLIKTKQVYSTQNQMWCFRHSRASNSKVKVWSGWNSNASKTLWLSWLPAKLMKTDQKWKRYPPDNIFSIEVYWKIFYPSRASNSEVNSPIWPKIKLASDFMTVFVTCKIRSKMMSLFPRQHFPHCKSMGAISKALKGM